MPTHRAAAVERSRHPRVQHLRARALRIARSSRRPARAQRPHHRRRYPRRQAVAARSRTAGLSAFALDHSARPQPARATPGTCPPACSRRAPGSSRNGACTAATSFATCVCPIGRRREVRRRTTRSPLCNARHSPLRPSTRTSPPASWHRSPRFRLHPSPAAPTTPRAVRSPPFPAPPAPRAASPHPPGPARNSPLPPASPAPRSGCESAPHPPAEHAAPVCATASVDRYSPPSLPT